MNRLLGIVFLLLLAVGANAEIYFYVNFAGAEPPQSSFLPRGGGVLNGSEFFGVVYFDNTAPISATLFQENDGGQLNPVAAMNIIFAAYPPSDLYAGGTAFSAEKGISLSDSDIANLMAGRWYAQIDYPDATYTGQFVVPEPSSSALLLAAGLAGWLFRARENCRS